MKYLSLKQSVLSLKLEIINSQMDLQQLHHH